MLTNHNPYDLMMEELDYINCIDKIDQRTKGLQDHQRVVRELREAYWSSDDNPNYESEALRVAYLLTYYPHYIQPIAETLMKLDQSVFYPFENLSKLQACFFGAGPAPEVLGWLAAIKGFLPNIDSTLAHLFDKYHWSVGQIITRELVPMYWKSLGRFRYFPRIQDITDPFDEWTYSCSNAIKTSQMLIMQNCLNDEIGGADTLVNNIEKLMDIAPNDTLLVILDLEKQEAVKIMQRIETQAINSGNRVLISVSNGIDKLDTTVHTPKYITDNLLTGEHGLKPKRWIKHYATVIQIKHSKLDDIPF